MFVACFRPRPLPVPVDFWRGCRTAGARRPGGEGRGAEAEAGITMAQTGQISGHLFLSTFEDINAVLEEEPPKRSVFITDFAEQVLEMNIRSIIQVGHQLAVIGDECNRRYSGKVEDPLFQLAKGIMACVFQTRFWGKNVMKTVGSSLDKSWRKKIIDYVWLVWIPLNCVFQKWGPALLMAAFTWWLHELQN